MQKTANRNILKEEFVCQTPAEEQRWRSKGVFLFLATLTVKTRFCFFYLKKKKERKPSGSDIRCCCWFWFQLRCVWTWRWEYFLPGNLMTPEKWMPGVIQLSGGSGRMRNTNQTCFPTTRSCCLTLLLLLLSGILRLSCPLTLQTAPVLDFHPPPSSRPSWRSSTLVVPTLLMYDTLWWCG